MDKLVSMREVKLWGGWVWGEPLSRAQQLNYKYAGIEAWSDRESTQCGTKAEYSSNVWNLSRCETPTSSDICGFTAGEH